MGDSFTEGVGIDYSMTFVGRIAEALSADGIEVLNGGVSSYSPIIYWKKTQHLIEEVGLGFDEMVVFLDISDPQDEARFYYLDDKDHVALRKDHPVTTAKGAAGLERVVRNPTGRVPAWVAAALRDNTIVIYALMRGARAIARPRDGGSADALNLTRAIWTTDDRVFEAYGRLGLERMQLHMDKLADLLRDRNIGLTIAVYPWPDQVLSGDLESRHVAFWREWCEARQLRFMNYFPLFVTGTSESERRQVAESYFIPGDVHFNSRGHELVAQAFLSTFQAPDTPRGARGSPTSRRPAS